MVKIDILTFAILPVKESGRFVHNCRSSSVVFINGLKLRWNDSNSLGEMLRPKYLIFPVERGRVDSWVAAFQSSPSKGKMIDFVQFIESSVDIFVLSDCCGKRFYEKSE